jgi:hypothetical protein
MSETSIDSSANNTAAYQSKTMSEASVDSSANNTAAPPATIHDMETTDSLATANCIARHVKESTHALSNAPDKQLTRYYVAAEKQPNMYRKHPIKLCTHYRGCTSRATSRKPITNRAKPAKPTVTVHSTNEQTFETNAKQLPVHGRRSVVVDEQSDHPKCQTKAANVNGESKTNQQLEATRANRLTVMTPRQQSQQRTVTDPANVKPDQQPRVMINSPEAMVSIETKAHIHAHELQKALVTRATAVGKGNDVVGRCLTNDGEDVMHKALQSYRATICNANSTQSEVDTANSEMTQLYLSVQHLSKPTVQPSSNTTTHDKPHQINESSYVNGAAAMGGQEYSTEHDLGTPNGTASAQPDRPSDD